VLVARAAASADVRERAAEVVGEPRRDLAAKRLVGIAETQVHARVLAYQAAARLTTAAAAGPRFLTASASRA
jgi:hypothetical protein